MNNKPGGMAGGTHPLPILLPPPRWRRGGGFPELGCSGGFWGLQVYHQARAGCDGFRSSPFFGGRSRPPGRPLRERLPLHPHNRHCRFGRRRFHWQARGIWQELLLEVGDRDQQQQEYRARRGGFAQPTLPDAFLGQRWRHHLQVCLEFHALLYVIQPFFATPWSPCGLGAAVIHWAAAGCRRAAIHWAACQMQRYRLAAIPQWCRRDAM